MNTLLDTQPKESGGAGGLSREDEVKLKIEKDLIPDIPKDFVLLDVYEKLKNLKGPPRLGAAGKYGILPLNIFLK